MHYQKFLAISMLLAGVSTAPVPDTVSSRDIKSAADDAYKFTVRFSDESELASNFAWAQILKDPAFKGSILKNPVLTNPIKGSHSREEDMASADEA